MYTAYNQVMLMSWTPSYGVEHEAVDSLSGGEDHHGGTAIQSITCSNDVSSRLQSIILTRLIVRVLQNKMWKISAQEKTF